jgi:hypothetical protein
VRIENEIIQDVCITPEFVYDYEHLSNKRVKRAMDKYWNFFVEHQLIPNSLQAHKAENFDLWIGYVTVGRKAWRLLFTYDEASHVLLLCRLVNHDVMDGLWKTY